MIFVSIIYASYDQTSSVLLQFRVNQDPIDSSILNLFFSVLLKPCDLN
jgi:hypothetical protein